MESISLHVAPGYLLTKTGYNVKHMREVERQDIRMRLFADSNVLIEYKGKKTIVWGSIIKEGVLLG